MGKVSVFVVSGTIRSNPNTRINNQAVQENLARMCLRAPLETGSSNNNDVLLGQKNFAPYSLLQAEMKQGSDFSLRSFNQIGHFVQGFTPTVLDSREEVENL